MPENIGEIESSVEMLAHRLGIDVEEGELSEKTEKIEEELFARLSTLEAKLVFIRGNFDKGGFSEKIRSIRERVARYSDNFAMLGNHSFSELLLGRALAQETEKVINSVEDLIVLESDIAEIEKKPAPKPVLPDKFRVVKEAEEFVPAFMKEGDVTNAVVSAENLGSNDSSMQVDSSEIVTPQTVVAIEPLASVVTNQGKRTYGIGKGIKGSSGTVATVVSTNGIDPSKQLLIDEHCVLREDGSAEYVAHKVIDGVDISNQINFGSVDGGDLVLKYKSSGTSTLIGCPRDMEIDSIEFKGGWLSGKIDSRQIKVIKHLDSSIEISGVPTSVTEFTVSYNDKRSFLVNQEKVSREIKNIRAHTPIVSPEMRLALEMITSDMFDADKVKIITDEFFASKLVYSLDANFGKILESLPENLRMSFLNGIGCGSCMTFTLQLHNLLSLVGVRSVVEGGPTTTDGGKTFGNPGHAQLKVYIGNKTIIIDPTLRTDKEYELKIPNSEVNGALPVSKLEAYERGQYLRKEYLKANNNKQGDEVRRGHNLDDGYQSLENNTASPIITESSARRLCQNFTEAVDSRKPNILLQYFEDDSAFVNLYKRLDETKPEQAEALNYYHQAIEYAFSIDDEVFSSTLAGYKLSLTKYLELDRNYGGIQIINRTLGVEDLVKLLGGRDFAINRPPTTEEEKAVLVTLFKNIHDSFTIKGVELYRKPPDWEAIQTSMSLCAIRNLMAVNSLLNEELYFEDSREMLAGLTCLLDNRILPYRLLYANNQLRPALEVYNYLKYVILPAQNIDIGNFTKDSFIMLLELFSRAPTSQDDFYGYIVNLVRLFEMLPGDKDTARRVVGMLFKEMLEREKILEGYLDDEGWRSDVLSLHDPKVRLYFELMDNHQDKAEGDANDRVVCSRLIRFYNMGYVDLAEFPGSSRSAAEPWGEGFWSMNLATILGIGLENERIKAGTLSESDRQRMILRDAVIDRGNLFTPMQKLFIASLAEPYVNSTTADALMNILYMDFSGEERNEICLRLADFGGPSDYSKYLLIRAKQIGQTEEFAGKYSEISKNSFLYFSNLMLKLPKDAQAVVKNEPNKAFDDAYLSQFNLHVRDLMVQVFPEYNSETSNLYRSALELLMLEEIKALLDQSFDSNPDLIRPSYENGSWLDRTHTENVEEQNKHSLTPFIFDVHNDALTQFSLQLTCRLQLGHELINREGEEASDIRNRLRVDISAMKLMKNISGKDASGRGFTSGKGRNSTYDSTRRTLLRSGDPNGTRDAVPGDAFGNIDHKASARKSEQQVREYHPEINQSGSAVEILIDARSLYGAKDDKKVINTYRRLQEKILALRASKKLVSVSVFLNGIVLSWDANEIDRFYKMGLDEEGYVPGEEFFVKLDEFRKHLIFVKPESIEAKILFAPGGNFIRAVPKKNPNYEAKNGKINSNSVKYIVLSDEESGREAVHYLENNLPVSGIEIDHIVCSEGFFQVP